MPPSAKAFPAPPGSGVRCTLYATFWLMCRKEKGVFAAPMKEIWPLFSAELAHRRIGQISKRYEKRLPRAIETLGKGLEDSLAFYAFPAPDARKTSSTNMLERLNREIRRRTGAVKIFPNSDSYFRLVTTYLMEYAEGWSVSRAYLSSKFIQPLLRNAA